MAGDLTALQWANEIKTDPAGLGLPAFAAQGDYENIVGALNQVRDGVTAYLGNSIVGPSGQITGASTASPIVITSPGHTLNTGDHAIISGVGGNTTANNNISGSPPTPAAWPVTKLDANTFSLNGSAGSGTYTSGGTWQWCVYGQPNTSIATADAAAAIAVQDVPGWNNTSSPATAQQQIIIAAYQTLCNQPSSQIELVNSQGVETVTATNLKKVAGGTGTNSFIRLSNLELRFGSRAEQLTGLIGSPFGVVVTNADIEAALQTGQA